MTTITPIHVKAPVLEAPPAPEEAVPVHHERLPAAHRAIVLAVILLPFAGFLAAVVHAWGWGVGWTEVALLLSMYLLTGLGVTVGYHRLFTHRAFGAGRTVTAALGILGSMAVEGPLLRWVAVHRAHHQHSDTHDDPHSPHGHGSGVRGILVGFYRAHMGWMLLRSDRTLARYTADLRKDHLVRGVSRMFFLWVALGLLIPTAIGGLVSMSWMGALLGLLWGGLLRIFILHHVTWSVNSVCHLWGTRPFRSHDESRNNPIVGVLALGEGWHNNHHAFPTSARHGLRWWEIDVSWMFIWALARLGLAWEVRLPSLDRMAGRRRSPRD